MIDNTIIFKGIITLVPETHPAVALYVRGGINDRIKSIKHVTKAVMPIFRGAYDISEINVVAKEFLDDKKILHNKGLLDVKFYYPPI